MMRQRLVVAVDALIAFALLLWVGGHVALGAFAARIVFRDLPRGMAAPTMTTVFHEFSSLMLVCMVLLCVLVGLRVFAARPTLRSERIALGATAALVALGVLEAFYVQPSIETMFRAGRTLEPAFASMHRLSERCGHLELILALVILFALSWTRLPERRP